MNSKNDSIKRAQVKLVSELLLLEYAVEEKRLREVEYKILEKAYQKLYDTLQDINDDKL
jgi:hypothetical protein